MRQYLLETADTIRIPPTPNGPSACEPMAGVPQGDSDLSILVIASQVIGISSRFPVLMILCGPPVSPRGTALPTNDLCIPDSGACHRLIGRLQDQRAASPDEICRPSRYQPLFLASVSVSGVKCSHLGRPAQGKCARFALRLTRLTPLTYDQLRTMMNPSQVTEVP